MLTDEKFAERAMNFALLKNCDGKYFGYEDYRKAIEANQTDKDKKVVYLYATDTIEQYQYIEAAKNKGYDVLLFDCQLDAHFVNLLESKLENSQFVRVDADSIDKLIKKEEISEPELTDAEKKDLSSIFESVLPEGNHYYVKAENLGETGAPILITQSEFMRRYRDMSALGGGMNFYGEMPVSYNIGINVEHPLIKRILDSKIEKTAAGCSGFDSRISTLKSQIEKVKDSDKQEDKDLKSSLEKEIEGVEGERKAVMVDFAKDNVLIHQVVDLALLANNMLKGKDLSEFIKRSIEVL